MKPLTTDRGILILVIMLGLIVGLIRSNSINKDYHDALIYLQRGDSIFNRSESNRTTEGANDSTPRRFAMLQGAIDEYTTSLQYYGDYYAAREKIAICYIRMAGIKPEKKYFDSLEATYFEALEYHSSVSFLFKKILSEVTQEEPLFDTTGVYNSLRGQMIANLVRSKEHRTDATLRESAEDVYSLSIDTLALSLLKRIKAKTERDYLWMANLAGGHDDMIATLDTCIFRYPNSCDCMTSRFIYDSTAAEKVYALKALQLGSECADKLAYSLVREFRYDEKRFYQFALTIDTLTSYMVSQKPSEESRLLAEPMALIARGLLRSPIKNQISYHAKELAIQSKQLDPDCIPCWMTLVDVLLKIGPVEYGEAQYSARRLLAVITKKKGNIPFAKSKLAHIDSLIAATKP